MKCTVEQAEAIVRLSALPEWKHVVELIGSHGESLLKPLIMNDDINVDIKRGELRSISQLSDVFTDAHRMVAASNQPKK